MVLGHCFHLGLLVQHSEGNRADDEVEERHKLAERSAESNLGLSSSSSLSVLYCSSHYVVLAHKALLLLLLIYISFFIFAVGEGSFCSAVS